MYNYEKGYLMVLIMLKDVLKLRREVQNLKQSEVAEFVGVTPQTYMKWENGKNEPKASNIKKLAEILKISESEICQGIIFSSNMNPLDFMKKVALFKNYLDDVTFTSILFDCIQDKDGFLNELERTMKKHHKFGVNDLDKVPDEDKYAALEMTKIENQIDPL